jgi:hypothetical protein
MRKTYKYRIYLTQGQRRILREQLEKCRWVYNQMSESGFAARILPTSAAENWSIAIR